MRTAASAAFSIEPELLSNMAALSHASAHAARQ
jgi:hypothetical protein